jgi:phage-related protein
VAGRSLRSRLRSGRLPGRPAGRAAETLGEPYTRHLGGKVRELRFRLLRQQTRVTYWLAPDRRIVLLTVFHKTRGTETAEVERAIHAQKMGEAEHAIAHDVYERGGC